MELKQFIKAVLKDITDAISESQRENKNGSYISPSSISIQTEDTVTTGYIKSLLRDIEFDVCLTAEKSSDEKASTGIDIKILSASIASGEDSKSTVTQRVRFSIPVIYPLVKVEPPKKKYPSGRNDPSPTLQNQDPSCT